MSPSNTRNLVICFKILLLSSLFWFPVHNWINNGAPLADWHAWIFTFVRLVILSAFLAVDFMIEKKHWLHWINSFLVLVPFLLFFPMDVKYAIPFAILFVSHHVAFKKIQNESEQRTKISPIHITRVGLPWIIMPLLILISFSYYLSPEIQDSKKDQQLPPMVTSIIDKTVETVVGKQTEELTPNQSQTVINQVKKEIFGQLDSWFKPYYIFLPSILTFGFFLIMWGFSFIFIGLSILLATLIFNILKNIGLIKVEEIDIKAERIIK